MMLKKRVNRDWKKFFMNSIKNSNVPHNKLIVNNKQQAGGSKGVIRIISPTAQATEQAKESAQKEGAFGDVCLFNNQRDLKKNPQLFKVQRLAARGRKRKTRRKTKPAKRKVKATKRQYKRK